LDRATLSPRDRHALVAVAVQFFANGAMTASFIARAPQIRDGIGVAIEGFGFLLTVAATIGILSSLVAGRVVHRATTRSVLKVGAVAMVGSLPIIGVARTPAVWLAGMFLYVFFDTLVDISMNLQGSWLSARRHTPIMNRLHGLWSMGFLAGGLGAVAANASGLSPFIHLLIVAVIMAGVLVFVTHHLLPNDEETHGDELASAARGNPARRSRVPVVLLVLAGMFAVVTEVTGGDWAAFRLADDFEAPSALASAAFVAYTLGMTIMRFGGDLLQLRLGRVGLHRLSVFIATVGFATASLIPNQAVSVVGFLLVGFGVATFMPKLYDDAARLPGRRGAGLGAMTAGTRAAYLLTPVLVGALAGASSSVGGALAILSVPALLSLVVVTEWSERVSRHVPTRRS